MIPTARLGVLAATSLLVAAGCSPSVVPSATGGSPGPTGGQASPGAPSIAAPSAAPQGSGAPPPTAASPFPNGVLIADRGNGRLLVLDASRRIVWTFPAADSFSRPTPFNADDAFFSPDGKTITANDEGRHVIYRIDVATRKVVWAYGHLDRAGSARGYLNTPDDAYGLVNGDIVIADINNCRILEIAPDKSIVRQWGRTGDCRTHAPATYGAPNGDTPLPDGGLLVTQIDGHRVERLAADGSLMWDIRVPIAYPSDAQLDANGNVVVAGFTDPGAVVCMNPTTGKVLWLYRPTSGAGRLNHPSLAMPLANGMVSINDDDRNRLVVLDPAKMKLVWQYGTTDRAGSGPGQLSDPDG
ncbi:MAG TPA: PQQ-binding-like beta-propeller repeat protein, partial [Candidatus Limnocylindrales bacterium]